MGSAEVRPVGHAHVVVSPGVWEMHCHNIRARITATLQPNPISGTIRVH